MVLCFVVVLLVFIIDLLLPLGVAGGVPYILAVLLSVNFSNTKYTIGISALCSILVVLGYYLSPEGGELWKVLANRFLALFAIWVTALIIVKWRLAELKSVEVMYQQELEKEKIYLATIYGAEHITNNLLNKLKLVELEIENHPGFDSTVRELFNEMMLESALLMKRLSSVEKVDVDAIKGSVYPKK